MDDDIRVEKNSNGIETYIFDPYNPVNIPITEDDIKGILRRYGINIPIFNYELYKRAFIHRSYIRRPNLENEANNISLELDPKEISKRRDLRKIKIFCIERVNCKCFNFS